MLDQSIKSISLGDRMKSYEKTETEARFNPEKPLYCRIDGRNFSKFTKDMVKPFDERLSMIMIEVTKYLVKETGAILGYTQSDEISLAWEEGKFFFQGRKQKMTSNIASLATAKFLIEALKIWPEKCSSKLPTFDARIFEVPNRQEVANSFLWRAEDAYKNSISMAAHEQLGHKKILSKNGEEKIQMLKEVGIDFNAFPNFFKFGTFVRPVKFEIDIEELNLPKHIAEKQNRETFIRRKIQAVDIGFFKDVEDRVGFVFG